MSIVTPKISVVMPVYNAEKYLREAMDSILSQTYTDFEFIIIDDGSVDTSPEIVRSYDDARIRFYQNEHNMGVAATLNRGLDLAEGEYIARMDSDDISLPERFARQMEYMDAHPECIICGSNLILLEKGKDTTIFKYSERDAEIRADLIFNCAFAHPSVMFNAALICEHNLRYDLSYEKAEDYELWSRALAYGRGYNIQIPLLKYRKHEGQVTQTHKNVSQNAVVRLHKKMLQELGATLNDNEFAVFLKICSGERTLTKPEHSLFMSGGKKVIAVSSGFSKEIRHLYSVLNVSICCKTHDYEIRFFSIEDMIRQFYYKVVGIGSHER